MKISTKGRYGLRSIVDLAVNSAGDHVPLNSIAERQNVSENYLEQVFSTLRKAGLVKSIKGAQGGYILSKRMSSITVGDVLRALEGDLSVIDGTSESKNASQNMEQCLSKNVWEKINESINSIVDSITIEDLVNEYKKLNGNEALMFYI
jgi:Rrf2 family transcriptional regulator, cysteine metabolism repressor